MELVMNGSDSNSVVNQLLNSSGSVDSNATDIETKILTRMSQVEIWGYGFLFVTIISLSSVMGIIFFPLMKKSFYAMMMRVMIGLAIGSLSGSALFHLIPQAFGLVESHPGYLVTISFVWYAIWGVMILECTIKIGVKMRAKSKRKKDHKLQARTLNPQNNNPPKPTTAINGLNGYAAVSATSIGVEDRNDELSDAECDGNTNHKESLDDDQFRHGEHDPHLNLSIPNLPVYRSTLSLNKVINKINATEEDETEKKKEIKTVAWIIIIGDSLHNFIDGISIGAGFVQSFSTGAVLSLAIMCEEFPHELGDFAILINSGLSVKKALLLNFLSALTCYLGLMLGILLGEIEWANLIFAFAAGIFLYVALGDMVPEVTSLIDEVSDVSPAQAVKVMLTHNLGILIGSAILFVLAKYQ